MIQVNIKSLWDSGRDLVRHFSSLDLTEYLDELKFLDAGSIGQNWVQQYDHREASYYRRCIAFFKQDDSDRWETFDDILQLLEWIACGRYQRVHVPPDGDCNCLYYRFSFQEREVAPRRSSCPAQLRISTPATYTGEDPLAYIHIKIEYKLPGETGWTIDETFGLHDVLHLLYSGLYGTAKPDIDKPERIFRRLY